MAQKKNLRRLMLCAVLTAMSVVLAMIAKQIFTNNSFFRITFENLPIIFAAVFFGPLYGGAMAGCADVLTTLVSGGALNPFITLGAISVGVVSGLVSHLLARAGIRERVIISCAAGHIVGNMTIKTLALYFMFRPGPIVFIRIPTYILICALECAAILLLYKNNYIRKKTEELQ